MGVPSACKQEKEQGQRSALFFLQKCVSLINFIELTVQQLDRLTFDLQIESGRKWIWDVKEGWDEEEV